LVLRNAVLDLAELNPHAPKLDLFYRISLVLQKLRVQLVRFREIHASLY
jgi:hypothetical protein